MTVEQEIRSYQTQIEELRHKSGVRNLCAYEQVGESGAPEPMFVADFDASRMEGYSDRFFEVMFGLQRIFARPVDVWEKEMFEQEGKRVAVKAIPLELQHAA
jgi:hypothetical protein